MSLIQNWNTSISTAGYVALKAPKKDEFHSIVLVTADEAGFYVSYDNGTTETFVPNGALQITFPRTIRYGSDDVELCKVKGTSTTTLGGIAI
jgi:hypothetical protein